MTNLHTAAQQDIPDLIAGALGVSRGTAYDLMREALAQERSSDEQPAQRTLVGLTDDEVQVMAFKAVKNHPEWHHMNHTVPVGKEAAPFVSELYRAIEAKLREKNSD